jgi:hypothetical protein
MRTALVLLFTGRRRMTNGLVDVRDRFGWVYTPRVCHGARAQQITQAMGLGSRGGGTISAVSAANPR